MHHLNDEELVGSQPQQQRDLARLETVAYWMDKRFLDPILGLVFPGAGDTLGALIGLYGIVVAIKMRVHPLTIARMLVNLALDALIGAIPLVGWAGDFLFKANSKNLRLLQTRGPSADATTSDRLTVGAAVLFLVLALITPLVLALLAAGWLLGQIQ